MKALGGRFSNQDAGISADIWLRPTQEVKARANKNADEHPDVAHLETGSTTSL